MQHIGSDKTEADLSNNEVTTEFGYADLRIEDAKVSLVDDIPTFTGKVSNKGYDKAEKIVLNVYDTGVNGELLATIKHDLDLVPGEEEEFIYNLPEKYWSLLNDNMYYEVCIQAVTDTNESRIDNNVKSVLFENLYEGLFEDEQEDPDKVENPFVDINESNYYYEPVLWAYEQGITAGKDATHFQPDNGCQRCQVVTFLYRAYVE